MKLYEKKTKQTTKVLTLSAIMEIIKDIAYIVSQIFKSKEKNEKLKLLKELDELKIEIKKAIDSGDEAKLSELLKKRKDIEERINVLNAVNK